MHPGSDSIFHSQLSACGESSAHIIYVYLPALMQYLRTRKWPFRQPWANVNFCPCCGGPLPFFLGLSFVDVWFTYTTSSGFTDHMNIVFAQTATWIYGGACNCHYFSMWWKSELGQEDRILAQVWLHCLRAIQESMNHLGTLCYGCILIYIRPSKLEMTVKGQWKEC